MVQTERGYEDPSVRQLAIFLQNRVGELGDVLRHLEASHVRVHAVSVADSVDFAVVRLIVDHVDAAKKCLGEAKFSVSQSSLLAVEIPDEGDGLLAVCRSLIRAEINIHYAYPMLTRPRGRGAILIQADNLHMGADVLTRNGFRLLDEHDLATPA